MIKTESYPRNTRANVCPFCKSSDIVGGPIDIESGQAFQECDCQDCGMGWTDNYYLKSYTYNTNEKFNS
jgi:transposase-like protein